MRYKMRSILKVPLNPTEMASVKCWLKRMRREDPNFADAPKARFGKSYVKLEITTALAVMPWTDTRTSGDLDAYRFKTKVIAALRALEAKEKSPWWRGGITQAIELIQDTPVGEYMTGPAPKIETKKRTTATNL